MEYRIDREALAAFVARPVDVVEAGAMPALLAQVAELRLRHESVSRDEVQALWLGAGLATHVGLAIFEEPELTSFVAGPTLTFPLWVYGAVKTGIPPQVFGIGTVIFAGGIMLTVLNVVWQRRRPA